MTDAKTDRYTVPDKGSRSNLRANDIEARAADADLANL